MTEGRRKVVLAAAAGLLLVLLGVQAFLPADPRPTSSQIAGGETASVGTRALPGAPPGLTRAELAERYALVLDVGLFEERSFRDRPLASTQLAAAAPSQRAARRDRGGSVGVSLRLTGLLGEGDLRRGVLEERGTGRGLVAGVGLRVGDVVIKEIDAAGLVLERAGEREQVLLGELLTLPASARSALKPLRVGAGAAKKKPATSSTPAVELSQERRMSILEKLKAARRVSMDKKKDSK